MKTAEETTTIFFSILKRHGDYNITNNIRWQG